MYNRNKFNSFARQICKALACNRGSLRLILIHDDQLIDLSKPIIHLTRTLRGCTVVNTMRIAFVNLRDENTRRLYLEETEPEICEFFENSRSGSFTFESRDGFVYITSQ
jgi:hypothetical protein